MTVFEVSRELLQQLHQKLIQKFELESQMQRGPSRIKSCTTVEGRAAEAVETAKQNLQKMRMESHDKQLQLKQRETKIEDLKNKRNACNSNREYSLLNEQIAADLQANSVLQDEILELLEAIDQQDATIAQLNQKLQLAKAETAKVQAEVDKRSQSLQADLDVVSAELKSSESQLRGSIVTEYRRRVASKRQEALAPLDGDTCGNCSQILTIQTVNEIGQSRSHTCPSCDSILYQPENCASEIGSS